MNALVTGAGGFLGQYLVEQLLDAGWQVRALARGNYPALQRPGVERVCVDLRHRESTIAACRNQDVVFHAAGVAGIWGPWQHYYEINTLGTQHIIDGCRQAGVPRLIYTSSPSVTFDGRDQCHVDETAPYPKHWLCAYPQTKALAEQAVLAANDAQLATCSLRPHLIWGPRDGHLIPRLLDRARRGQLRRVGDGQNLIDITYVENAATAHLQAAAALTPGGPTSGRAYFISQGQPVNCWQWIDEILAMVNLPPVRSSISTAAAWQIGRLLEWKHRLLRLPDEPRMTRFLAAQLGRSHYFQIDRARQDFGYAPAISTSDGMRRLSAWLANSSDV